MATPALDLPDLTLPQGDTRTVRRVLAAFLQRMVQDLLRIPDVTPRDRALYQQVCRLVTDLARQEPKAALQLVRMPTVSVLIQNLHKPDADPAWLRELCALVLLELAAAGRLPAQGIALGTPLPVLRAPGLNLQLVPGPAQTLRFLPGRLLLDELTIPLHDAAFQAPGLTRPYHTIAPGLWLAETDNNPLSEFEAHPDKHGNQLDLGGRPASAWVAMLQQALALIETHLPVLAEEIRLVLRLVVPVGYEPEKHLSASYQEAIGLIYMTLHPNLMTMTEALIHEFQHNKINAAFVLDPLLQNAWTPLYASPVRPDPRPLHGVILAVHAFQPVAALYEAMAAAGHELARSPHFDERFRQIVKLNHEGATTVLDHAQPTSTGAPLFAEMRRLDEHFRHDRPF